MKIVPFLRSKIKNSKPAQQLFEKIESLLSSARNLFTQSEGLKKVVARQKISVQQSSAAAHEISSMVSTTASAAEELSRLAGQSNEAVTSSAANLNLLVDLISEVDRSSQALQQSVKSGLSEISSVTDTMLEIRNKAKIIKEIVFQTKLLSFNASVEAARAGEHGKGFAVVADEMGQLARASGDAAKEIETILNLSVEKTKNQIGSVTGDLEKVAQETISAISSVSIKGSEISSAFVQLKDFSEVTEAKAKEISTATEEQKIGVHEISKSLAALELTSDELDQMSMLSHKGASDLSDSVEEIMRLFSVFAENQGYQLVKVVKVFDFNAAIAAHIDWKMKLSRYLHQPDGSLEHEKVCLDNACVLGKWIHGEGQQHSHLSPRLFESVKDSHAKFHQTAGEIVRLINIGDRKKAELMLAPSGPYIAISDQTVSLIRQLKDVSAEVKKAA